MDEPGSWCVLLAVVCGVLAAFFSTLTLALRHISWARLEQAFARKKCPHRIQVIRERRMQMAYGSATGRLLANIALVLSLVCFFLTADPSGPKAVYGPLLKAFLLSFGVLILFSVTIPHAVARRAGTDLLVHSYPFLRVLDRLMGPMSHLIGWMERLVRRMSGTSNENAGHLLEEKQEELLNVVEEGQKEGVVDQEEREMIESVLEFRETTAGEIMTPRTDIVAIEAATDLNQAIEVIVAEGHSRYPVYERSIDNVIGILYAKDLLRDLNGADDSAGIKHRLRKCYFVPENKTLRELLHSFQTQKVHVAVVLDEYGGTAGLVTIEDILEELVGEIVDEHEPPEAEPLLRIDERTIEVDGRYEVDKLNHVFGLDLPESNDYESIGGFVVGQLGHIPPPGRTFDYETLHFTVLDAGPRKIHRLRIVLPPPPAQQPEQSPP